MKFSYAFGVLFVFILLSACNREDFYSGGQVDYSFSQDTLLFDTVFTSIGSTIKFVKVYNHQDQPVLAHVYLEPGQSFFRLNIDGTAGNDLKDVRIEGQDSIYIFVEVNIDPNQSSSDSPFIIKSKVHVDIGESKKSFLLEAFGQNANYIPGVKSGGISYKIPCTGGKFIMDDTKPYVIYGVMVVDSCTMVVNAGTRIFMHGGVIRTEDDIYNDGLILVLKHGNVRFEGTLDQPIIIEGDRLEAKYQDVRSQWAGIVLWQETRNNYFKHTIIKNSIVGIRMDSLAQASVNNCLIFNTGGAGISARHSTLSVTNSLLYENGGGGLIFSYGGQYSVTYTTVGSFLNSVPAIYLGDYYCPTFPCDNRIQIAPLKATLTNCVFSGGEDDEITLAQAGDFDDEFQYTFDHCLFRVKDLLSANRFPDFLDHCINPINYQDVKLPLFIDHKNNDFRLDTMSVVREKGKNISNIQFDLLEQPRKSIPDLGCYELNL